jgi:uncharacterized protein (TIGR00725 family)
VPRTHRIVIAVVGPSSCDDDQAEMARGVGAGIAARGAVLLCGGGSGVMEKAAAAAKAAGGLTMGLLPGKDASDSPPNAYIDIAVFTGLGEARAAVEIAAADGVIAIGGGFSTLTAIGLALRAKKPVVLLGSWSLELAGAKPQLPRSTTAPDAVSQIFAALGR